MLTESVQQEISTYQLIVSCSVNMKTDSYPTFFITNCKRDLDSNKARVKLSSPIICMIDMLSSCHNQHERNCPFDKINFSFSLSLQANAFFLYQMMMVMIFVSFILFWSGKHIQYIYIYIYIYIYTQLFVNLVDVFVLCTFMYYMLFIVISCQWRPKFCVF